jgi:hypothetical protein
MTVLVIYVLLVAVFEAIICMVGIALDKVVPSGWNIIVAMGLFFSVLALMWPVAVFITERFFVGEKSDSRAAAR